MAHDGGVIECLAWQSESLMEQLLRYTQALFTHMAQTSACNRHHGLDQKLCRWLLLNFDRRDGNEMILTQEQIASMLGVRREGVTASALKLRRAGLIQYRRGSISVLDRAGLEARSCDADLVIGGPTIDCGPAPPRNGTDGDARAAFNRTGSGY